MPHTSTVMIVPGSAVPVIVGVVLFASAGLLNVGTTGAVVSTTRFWVATGLLTPAGLVPNDVTTQVPSANAGVVTGSDHLPSAPTTG